MANLKAAESAFRILQKHFASSKYGITRDLLAVPHSTHMIPDHLIVHNSKPYPTAELELPPTEAVAKHRYHHFMHHSQTFFSSLHAGLSGHRSYAAMRPVGQVSVDLAKILRNLDLIEHYQLVLLKQKGYEPTVLNPYSKVEVYREKVQLTRDPNPKLYQLYPNLQLILYLKYSQHSPLWSPPDLDIVSKPITYHARYPWPMRLYSSTARAQFMGPEQIRKRRECVPPGIFIMFHHDLGLITDIQALQYNQGAMVLCHLGMPLSSLLQLNMALRVKKELEGSGPVLPLTRWSLKLAVQNELEQRQSLLVSMDVHKEEMAIKKILSDREKKLLEFVTMHDESAKLKEELISWELKDKLSELGYNTELAKDTTKIM